MAKGFAQGCGALDRSFHLCLGSEWGREDTQNEWGGMGGGVRFVEGAHFLLFVCVCFLCVFFWKGASKQPRNSGRLGLSIRIGDPPFWNNSETTLKGNRVSKGCFLVLASFPPRPKKLFFPETPQLFPELFRLPRFPMSASFSRSNLQVLGAAIGVSNVV